MHCSWHVLELLLKKQRNYPLWLEEKWSSSSFQWTAARHKSFIHLQFIMFLVDLAMAWLALLVAKAAAWPQSCLGVWFEVPGNQDMQSQVIS